MPSDIKDPSLMLLPFSNFSYFLPRYTTLIPPFFYPSPYRLTYFTYEWSSHDALTDLLYICLQRVYSCILMKMLEKACFQPSILL